MYKAEDRDVIQFFKIFKESNVAMSEMQYKKFMLMRRKGTKNLNLCKINL